MLAALQSMYADVRARVATPEGLTDPFECTLGVKQGCPLSPLLFGLYIDRLEPLIQACGGAPPELHGMPIPMLLYADDLLLISTSPEGLQNYLNALNSFCSASELCVNLTKTDVVIYNNCNKRKRSDPVWTFNGDVVNTKEEYKYLGLLFHCKHGFSRCVERLTKAGSRALHAMYHRCHELHLDVPDLMCNLFDSLIRPVLSYACEVWSKYPACAKEREKAEVLHRRFLKRCAGVVDATPSDIVYGEFGRTPLQVFWDRLAARYLERLQKHDQDTILGRAYLESAALHQDGHPSWVAHTEQPAAAESWEEAWQGRISNAESSKLQTYSGLKNSWGLEPYLSEAGMPRQHRVAMARLRMGSHWLGTQLGVYARAAERKRAQIIPCTSCSDISSTVTNPMLLCDHCNSGWHLDCLQLPSVPPDTWFCPPCVRAQFTIPVALDASQDRIAEAVRCPHCGDEENEWHAVFDCHIYHDLRAQYSDLFEGVDTLLAFLSRADSCARLGEFIFRCYRKRQAAVVGTG